MLQILFPPGIAKISFLLKIFKTTIAKAYIIIATPIDTIVANFAAIIPDNVK